MNTRINDEYYMNLALEMAERAQGQTGMNPVVGCVVVKDGRMVGLGTHLKRGTPHAEVHALNMAGEQAKDSVVYVTLEPCSHHGLTPPCAERLIREGVKRVIVAMEDPNPKVSGQGIALLRKSGVEVDVGLLEERARKLNRFFIKNMSTGLPYVTLKTASTLDGRTATSTGDSKWISNEVARQRVHALRHRHHAIMVGVQTVIADNPSLTTRLDVQGLHATRIVMDSQLRIPLDCHLVQDQLAPTIVITTEEADPTRRVLIEAMGVTVLSCGKGPQVDLRKAMITLGKMDIGSILLEGGGTLNGAMLEADLIDEVILFIAPKIVGDISAPGVFSFKGPNLMSNAFVLDDLNIEILEDNVCMSGRPRRH